MISLKQNYALKTDAGRILIFDRLENTPLPGTVRYETCWVWNCWMNSNLIFLCYLGTNLLFVKWSRKLCAAIVYKGLVFFNCHPGVGCGGKGVKNAYRF